MFKLPVDSIFPTTCTVCVGSAVPIPTLLPETYNVLPTLNEPEAPPVATCKP